MYGLRKELLYTQVNSVTLVVRKLNEKRLREFKARLLGEVLPFLKQLRGQEGRL